MEKLSKIKIILINIAALLLICTIGLFIFKGWMSSYTNHGARIEVPNFANLSFAEAQQIAEQNNINLVVFDTVFDETRKGNTVVTTKPSAGSFVKGGRTVYATVNSSQPLMVRVPKLINMSLRQAQINIEAAGLTLGSVDYVPGRANDYVLEAKYKNKTIEAGTKIAKRSSIDLLVEKGGEGGSLAQDYITPNLIGANFREASKTISNIGAGFEAIFDSRYSYKTAEDSLNAIVWKQLPEADSLSSSSTITIYLMKQ